MRRSAPTAAAAPGEARGAPPDLRRSLESTREGLDALLTSLEGSGFSEAIGPYEEMKLVLIQQRLWSRNQGRWDLDPAWAEIARVAGAVHEILAGFDAVMRELAEIDRIEPTYDGASVQVNGRVELARFVAEGTSLSERSLRSTLPWPDDVRRRRLAELVQAGVLERRGWGRGLSYRLSEASRRDLTGRIAEIFAAARPVDTPPRARRPRPRAAARTE